MMHACTINTVAYRILDESSDLLILQEPNSINGSHLKDVCKESYVIAGSGYFIGFSSKHLHLLEYIGTHAVKANQYNTEQMKN